jgi:hypothetical protein
VQLLRPGDHPSSLQLFRIFLNTRNIAKNFIEITGTGVPECPPEVLEGLTEWMIIVGYFLFESLPCFVEPTQIDKGERLDGAVLDGRDAESVGERRGAVAASDTVRKLRRSPVCPHRIEEMFIERDQVASTLQSRSDSLNAL